MGTVYTPTRLTAYLFAASAFLGLHGAAHADDDHQTHATPPTIQAAHTGKRLSTGEIVAKLERAGYSHITEVELDDGHYEVEARNTKGQRVELDVHAQTGKVFRTELDD